MLLAVMKMERRKRKMIKTFSIFASQLCKELRT